MYTQYNTTLANVSSAVVGTRGLAYSQYFVTRSGANGETVMLGRLSSAGDIASSRECVGRSPGVPCGS